MSTSETITRTDLTNILNGVLPINPFGVQAQTKTLTGTSDANGNVSLGFSASAVSVVLCVVGTSSSSFVYVPFTYGGNWYAKVMSSNSSHTSITNTSVSIIITYLQAAPYATADYIVEQGTSGIWTYRKWNNGDAECWAVSSSGAFAPSSTSGGGISYRILSATFPSSLFTTAPSAHVDCKWGTGISWASARTVSTTTLEYAVCKLNNSSDSAEMYFYAIGKWK